MPVTSHHIEQSSAPGRPDIVDYDNRSVDLKWTPPSIDGGVPIEKYIIEKKDKYACKKFVFRFPPLLTAARCSLSRYKPDWEKAGEVPGDKLEGKVVDLKERGEYQFRIVAVNKAGSSPPSEPTDLHLVKHKLRKLRWFPFRRPFFNDSVLFSVKPQIDRANLKQTMLKAGKVFKFDVNIKGEPPPTVTWFLADKEVVSQENVEIVNIDYNTKLNVIDAKRKNSGMYKIVAVNEHGKDEAEVEVVVLAAPSKPKGPLKVKDVTKSGCKLAWQPPEDDGGKPVTGYVVEKLDKGRWVPVGRSKDPEMEVGGLQEGKEYSFRVRAVNDEGESENLETDQSIIAKNPFGKLVVKIRSLSY